MQRTANFHHHVADTVPPKPDPIFDHTAALDTTVDMLNPKTTLMQGLVYSLLFRRQQLTFWFLHGHQDLHARQRERDKAQIL